MEKKYTNSKEKLKSVLSSLPDDSGFILRAFGGLIIGLVGLFITLQLMIMGFTHYFPQVHPLSMAAFAPFILIIISQLGAVERLIMTLIRFFSLPFNLVLSVIFLIIIHAKAHNLAFPIIFLTAIFIYRLFTPVEKQKFKNSFNDPKDVNFTKKLTSLTKRY